MSAEVQALEHFYAAINRNDMQAMTADFDPRIVRIEPEGFCAGLQIRFRRPLRALLAAAQD